MIGGGGAVQPSPPPAPPAPPTPPPPPAPVPAPPPPPPAPAAPPAGTSIESARVVPKDADMEAGRRAREGTSRLKKKPKVTDQTLRQPQAEATKAPGAGGLSYGGEVSGGGMSLNIQRQ